MADEGGGDSSGDLQNRRGADGRVVPAETGEPEPRRPWTREDRKRLLIWVGLSFILPGVLVYASGLGHKASTGGFRVGSELPIKGLMALFVALGTWVVARMEKRPLADYGIPPRGLLGIRFWEGLLWGFAMLSAIVLFLRATGHFQIDSVALGGAALFRYALGWGAAFMAVAINEEFAFRGYWLFVMARRLRFWRAALFLSVVFGVAHLFNPGENVFGILQVVVIGLLFCLTIRRTGTLWFAVGFHAAWDWAETFFYGTPDSGMVGVGHYLNTSVQGPKWLTGGSAGPEGSVIAFVVILLCALLIHLRFPRAVYPDRPA
ncbi:MAG: CPBP family intramembrane glutamic endopeptidase [Candidatus Acidiferrales bacterium]